MTPMFFGVASSGRKLPQKLSPSIKPVLLITSNTKASQTWPGCASASAIVPREQVRLA